VPLPLPIMRLFHNSPKAWDFAQIVLYRTYASSTTCVMTWPELLDQMSSDPIDLTSLLRFLRCRVMTKPAIYFLVLVSMLAVPGALTAQSGLSPQEAAAVRAANQAYPAAWLKNDKAAVKALFADDAVLLPSGGHAPVEGMAAIEKFFWPPDSPTFRVLKYEMTPVEVAGGGNLAYSWGKLALTFETAPGDPPKTSSSEGTYLMVFRKAGGAWKLARYMWNSHPVGQ
jgi:uncharacterized protein (TIGR02246 family)